MRETLAGIPPGPGRPSSLRRHRAGATARQSRGPAPAAHQHASGRALARGPLGKGGPAKHCRAGGGNALPCRARKCAAAGGVFAAADTPPPSSRRGGPGWACCLEVGFNWQPPAVPAGPCPPRLAELCRPVLPYWTALPLSTPLQCAARRLPRFPPPAPIPRPPAPLLPAGRRSLCRRTESAGPGGGCRGLLRDSG